MSIEIHIPYNELLKLSFRLLEKAGLKTIHSNITAKAICSASLRGVDSHGIRLLPHYIKAIQAGRINVNADFKFSKKSTSTGTMDAQNGMAHAAIVKAMNQAIVLAKESGVGFVSICNSNHCGAMAFYAIQACKHDMIGLAFTNATPKLQVYNSMKPYFGINPICVAAPMAREKPFCYDAAPCIMSNNKIKLLSERGELLPQGVAADKKGDMTIDPLLSEMLIPLGGSLAGYKGYAMAMVIDILCSLLSGMPSGKDVSKMYPKDGGCLSDKRYLGQFVGAIRIDVFEDVQRFKNRLQQTADNIRSLPRSKNAKGDVMIPGDPEKKAESHRLIHGIPVNKKLYELLIQMDANKTL